ncbi:SKP1-like protein 14, partial [Mucuna pruriens]
MAEETESTKTEPLKTAEEEFKKLEITEEEESELKLETSDHVTFMVEASIAMKFGAVQQYLEVSPAASASATAIPLHNVASRELILILEYYRMHDWVDAGERDLKEFDERFLKDLNYEELKELLLAANYLNVEKLFNFLTKSIANIIRNKDVEFVRTFFGIDNDYTPEEEAAYREENAWAGVKFV